MLRLCHLLLLNQGATVLQSGANEVEQFLTKQGVNSQALVDSTRGVTSKAEEAINYASPTVRTTATSLSAASPQLLAQYAIGLVAFYYLVSAISKPIFRHTCSIMLCGHQLQRCGHTAQNQQVLKNGNYTSEVCLTRALMPAIVLSLG